MKGSHAVHLNGPDVCVFVCVCVCALKAEERLVVEGMYSRRGVVFSSWCCCKAARNMSV